MCSAWVDGFYIFNVGGRCVRTADIKGEQGLMSMHGIEDEENERRKMTLKFGQFTNPDKRGLDATGKEHYNVEIYHVYHDKRSHGIVSEDGKKITLMDGNIFEFMDEEAKKKMKDEQDPAESPPNSYNPQPEQMGKILWITGVAGMGKTTTARLLQEKQGFVNYEGDCFLMGLNPYVGSAPEGSSYLGTRPLSGIQQNRKDICKLAMEKGYMEVLKGNPVDPEIWEDFYNLLCEDILKERAKLGGSWVVGQAVYSKAAREVIRRKLGDDLTMIVLESGEENLQKERLSARYLGAGEVSKEARGESEKSMAKYTGGQDSVEDDEENTFVIKVTKSMSPEDVAKIALTFV